VAENLESLVSRTIDVLLDEPAQPYFGGRENLKLAFSPEAFHEHPDAELVTYGSSFLDTLEALANVRGNTTHLYLYGLNPTMGRTLEKVRGQVRLPGHLMEAGDEGLLLFHHAFFRFKVSLIGEEREEIFQEKAVDLHTGWTTTGINEQSLRLFTTGEPLVKRELAFHFSLAEAYQTAKEKLIEDLLPQIKASQENLTAAYLVERKQVSEHYEALIAKIVSGKTHKGADMERLDAKTRATRTDLELRLQDLEKRYRLGLEIKLNQLAIVSYLKAAVPLRLQQGKVTRPFIAIWDSLTRQGYIAGL
jgi:hypothetical protein